MYFRQIRDKFMLHKRNVLQYVLGGIFSGSKFSRIKWNEDKSVIYYPVYIIIGVVSSVRHVVVLYSNINSNPKPYSVVYIPFYII